LTQITVTALYVLPEEKSEISLRLEQGATLADAMAQLHAHPKCQDWQVDASALGVFGKVRPLNWRLAEGDRVECYRTLETDPKTARRLRAAAQTNA